MIGGAIIAGPVAGTLDNIGAFMAMGTFAAILSSIYFGYIHPKINRTRVYDVYGALYIFIVSLFGTFMVAPLVIIGMIRNEVTSNLLMGNDILNADNAGWVLAYVGISAGVALVSGFGLGGLLRCFQNEYVR